VQCVDMINGSKMRCRQVQTARRNGFNFTTQNFSIFHKYCKCSW